MHIIQRFDNGFQTLQCPTHVKIKVRILSLSLNNYQKKYIVNLQDFDVFIYTYTHTFILKVN